MSFFAVLFALLLEQVKPLPRGNVIHDALTGWMRWTARNFDAGRESHAWVVWCVTVLAPALLTWALFAGLDRIHSMLGLAFDVGVLYLTLGFRQFSHYFTDIRDALDHGDESEARRLLSEWRHLDASELPASELLRHVIEHSLLAAHRHVFGVFFWFVLLSSFGLGPAGAVLYRMAELASRYWAFKSGDAALAGNETLMALSLRLFQLLDHVPARLTASGFAVVGNFEEAVNCWRRDAGLWRYDNEGVILATAAGAVGVRLGGGSAPGLTRDRAKTFEAGAPPDSAEAAGSTPGPIPELGHLRSVVGLVWRSVVLWMLLLALLSLANLIG
ncbi:MAG: CobD/CbiB family protein [Caldimonas sp.]